MSEEAVVTTGHQPLAGADDGFALVTTRITGISLGRTRTPFGWFGVFAVSALLAGGLVAAILVLLLRGVGIWGVNVPVGWGFAIINFVWWIGIGHAGTLISAILLLLNQQWRNSINRFAEAMTIFAVVCAGLFPVLHLGRPWLFYWLFPYPNTMNIQPQFRSPLVWDVFAVSTYATVSVLFWYLGMLPDLAATRDQAQNPSTYRIYGLLSLGWRGSSHQWRLHRTATLLLAGLATPLVLSVHTVVSFDFAVAIVPGWHATIFPPFFVAGAIYSGFALVVILAVVLRRTWNLSDLITDTHLANCAKVMLATSMIMTYSYFFETFYAWYSANEYEIAVFQNRYFGPYWPAQWTMLACNVVIPQLLWLPAVRRNATALCAISVLVLYGMWLERYIIVITSLHRDFLPSSWGYYNPTVWDQLTFFGTIGLFLFLFSLFVRFLPIIPMYEIREMLHKEHQSV
ncbi:MAG: polysulfide reductase NrfD [Bryobacteraceae bacterium]|nr:polysulfide reductase NrfD [Bryobacteraceae bacterium]